MQEIAHSECSVSVTRVSDAPETQFSFAMRKPPTLVDRAQSAALQLYLKRRLGWDVDEMCLSFIGYEGSRRHVAAQRHAVGQIVKRHGGLCIGSGPGVLYDQKKFDTPYIRDYLLDRGGAGDVSETAMPWSRLSTVYDAVTTAAQGAFRSLGVQGYLMCHLSHSYHAGACLYFTFAFRSGAGEDMLVQYDVVKSAIQQAFVDNGATLSHHHAVGTEHAPWLRAGHLRTRHRDAESAVRRDRPRAPPQPRQDPLNEPAPLTAKRVRGRHLPLSDHPSTRTYAPARRRPSPGAPSPPLQS